MAINKKLIHFNKKTTFNSQKLSANDSNTQYQVGGTGTVQTGAPDINYQSIVYIKDSKEIWTHGQFYATAVTWSTITGKPSFATVATSGSYNDLSNKPTIPTKLPTPNALTFTGAVTGTWDGSSAKTVNIPSGSSYTLPLASNSTRGGIKLSSSTQGGTPNGITTTPGRTYAVQVNSSEQAVVNVPWTDTNTTYSEATTSTSGLMSSSDKTKLNGLSSNMIKSRSSKVECDTSSDNITVYAPSAGVNIICKDPIELTVSDEVVATFNVDSDLHADITLGGGYNNIRIKSGSSAGSGIVIQADDGVRITGSVEASGGFFDTSDARVKANVKEIDASDADKVKLVEFDRTDKEHHGYGVIAQELEKVYPEMVNTDDEGFKSVNYNELAMVKIKYLEDKVARLEALVGRLLAE
nr:MAG: chaperone of endosialidase [Bacteriophage sp.]